MNRQTALIAIAIFAVLAALVAFVTLRRQGPEESEPEAAGSQSVLPDEDAAADSTLTVDLYFPGLGGRLRTERRELPANAETEKRIEAVIETLLAGPGDPGMRPPLADGVGLRKVYLAEDGLVFVDFQSPDGSPPPASGSQVEMLTVYSLVNTVLLNFEELERVVLLWNGRQLRTFAGHVDTARPLAADTGLVATAP